MYIILNTYTDFIVSGKSTDMKWAFVNYVGESCLQF